MRNISGMPGSLGYKQPVNGIVDGMRGAIVSVLGGIVPENPEKLDLVGQIKLFTPDINDALAQMSTNSYNAEYFNSDPQNSGLIYGTSDTITDCVVNGSLEYDFDRSNIQNVFGIPSDSAIKIFGYQTILKDFKDFISKIAEEYHDFLKDNLRLIRLQNDGDMKSTFEMIAKGFEYFKARGLLAQEKYTRLGAYKQEHDIDSLRRQIEQTRNG